MQQHSLHPVPVRSHRFLLLDGLRGVAAVMVVLYHAPHTLNVLPVAQNGYLAVDMFFTLSGFVIAFSYEQRLRGGYSLRSFLVARLIRLYPLFFLGTMVGTLIEFLIVHIQSQPGETYSRLLGSVLFGFLLLPDFAHHGTHLNFPMDPPAWSLFCELVANFVYAILISMHWAKSKVLLALSLGCLACMLFWTFDLSGTLDGGSIRSTFFIGLARVGYSFLVGVLAFRLWHKRRDTTYHGIVAILGAAAVCVSTIVILGTALTNAMWAQAVIVTVAFPLMVYCGAMIRLPSRFERVCTFLGDASYPLYLLHLPLFALFYGRTFRHFSGSHRLLSQITLIAYLPILLVGSWWLVKAYDVPVRKYLTVHFNRLVVNSNNRG